MAFDLYVGPASRYLAQNWKTIGQQYAEEQGYAFQVVRPQPSVFRRLFGPKPAKSFDAWRANIAADLVNRGCTDPLWTESPDGEYFTDRPGWEGHFGLLLLYAYMLKPELTPPTHLPADPASDTVILDLSSGPIGNIQHLSHCDIYLPMSFDHMFVGKGLNGGDVAISSLDRLNAALWEVCDLWGKDRMTMGSQRTDQPASGAPLEEAALHGLARYANLTDEALARRLPLIKDY